MPGSRREHASIVDVARLAGVSPTTVSRSLRGLKHVNAATRLRVQAAAESLSYVASPAGTGLASGRTLCVGVVTPLVTRWFFAQVVAGAAAVLRDAGYDLLLHDLEDAAGRERFFGQMPLRRRVDAVLVVSLALSSTEVSLLQSLKVPVATVGSQQAAFSGVRVDDSEGTRRAVRHLVNLGHTSVAMITALEDDDFGFASAQERRMGFRLGIEGIGPADHVMTGSWGFAGGSRAMETLLSGDRLPTAVVAEYDELAFGALLTLRRAGLDVPGDISVVGFDDHEMAPVMDLTTVAQPVRAQGEIAAELLIAELRGRTTEREHVVLPTRLVVRSSTAPPRRGQARGQAASAPLHELG